MNAAVRGNHGTSGGGRAWSNAWCVPAAAIDRCCVQMLDPACVQPENARAPAAWRGQHEPRHPTRAESSQLPRNDRVRAERSAQREPSGRCHRHTASSQESAQVAGATRARRRGAGGTSRRWCGPPVMAAAAAARATARRGPGSSPDFLRAFRVSRPLSGERHRGLAPSNSSRAARFIIIIKNRNNLVCALRVRVRKRTETGK